MANKQLTLKQENACLAYIETGNKSEAYRRAFNAENMKEATINKRANEFFDRGDIKGRIAELRKPVVEQVQITLKNHLEKLAELRDKADASEKWQAAIQAEIARGKASGLYVEKVETGKPGDFDRLNDEELERRLEENDRALRDAQAAIRKARASAREDVKNKQT